MFDFAVAGFLPNSTNSKEKETAVLFCMSKGPLPALIPLARFRMRRQELIAWDRRYGLTYLLVLITSHERVTFKMNHNSHLYKTAVAMPALQHGSHILWPGRDQHTKKR